jgi:hypothetical protein
MHITVVMAMVMRMQSVGITPNVLFRAVNSFMREWRGYEEVRPLLQQVKRTAVAAVITLMHLTQVKSRTAVGSTVLPFQGRPASAAGTLVLQLLL